MEREADLSPDEIADLDAYTNDDSTADGRAYADNRVNTLSLFFTDFVAQHINTDGHRDRLANCPADIAYHDYVAVVTGANGHTYYRGYQSLSSAMAAVYSDAAIIRAVYTTPENADIQDRWRYQSVVIYGQLRIRDGVRAVVFIYDRDAYGHQFEPESIEELRARYITTDGTTIIAGEDAQARLRNRHG